MIRGAAQVFLAALIAQQVTALIERLNTSNTADLEANMRDGYTNAYTAGALWSLLNLVRASAPHPKQLPANIDFSERLASLASRAGLEFVLTRTEPRDVLEKQAKIASTRLEEYRQITQGQPSAAEARAGVYAVRWGVQQGVDDTGRYSSAIGPNGEPVELLKTWLRLSRRVEHRSWHDALEGQTVPYSQKFKLVGPNGTFLVDRPYDPILPLRETIRCGHGIRVDPPDNAETINIWDGGDGTIPMAGPNENDAGSKITRAQAIKAARALAKTQGFSTITTSDRFKPRAKRDTIAEFDARDGLIYLNSSHDYWRNVENYMKKAHQEGVYSTEHPFHVIHHEIGHAKYIKINPSVFGGSSRFQRPAIPDAAWGNVSRYAQSEGLAEWISEVYAAKKVGYAIPDEVLAWYNQFGGP